MPASSSSVKKQSSRNERQMTNRYIERERKAKAVDLQSTPVESNNNSSRTKASHPLVFKYEPSRNLIKKAISSLPVAKSSTQVHQHHDSLKSTGISSQPKEKEIRTSSSTSNTINNNPPPVQPNIVFGSFPAQPDQANQQPVIVAATSSTTSSPSHPGYGILGRTPPDHGILGCKPIGYIYQHASPEVYNNLSAMYNVPYYYSGYQHASPEGINMQLSYSVPNSYTQMTVTNQQTQAKPSTSMSAEFLPGGFHPAQLQSQEGSDFHSEKGFNVASATPKQGWQNIYNLFPPPPSSYYLRTSSHPPPHAPAQGFGAEGKFGEDPNDPYYPLPAHFINMDEFI